MKAQDHYDKALRMQSQQVALDALNFSEIIIDVAHVAAHHAICAALEWLGDDPQGWGHAHGKFAGHLKGVQAPREVLEAWNQLERLRTKSFYGGATTSDEATEARGHLAAIQAWAQGLHP